MLKLSEPWGTVVEEVIRKYGERESQINDLVNLFFCSQVAYDEATDEFASYFNRQTSPKILITTSDRPHGVINTLISIVLEFLVFFYYFDYLKELCSEELEIALDDAC